MTAFRLSVPGNMLLAGEYMILEEGGLGAAIGVEPRLTVTVTPSHEWEIRGLLPTGSEVWHPESDPNGRSAPFAGQVFLDLHKAFSAAQTSTTRSWPQRIPPARIEIDSLPFFSSDGRKLGFGSSAALSVGLAGALARLQGRKDAESVVRAAVNAHRYAQGGRGSGYDVNASFFGGLGEFRGGETTAWTPWTPSILPQLAVFSGPAPIRTVGSIAAYNLWKTSHSEMAAELIQRSNQSVRNLFRSKHPTEFLRSWEVCRDLGIELGALFEVSAEVPREVIPPGAENLFLKSVGAGNETILGAGPAETFASIRSEHLRMVVVSPEGLREE